MVKVRWSNEEINDRFDGVVLFSHEEGDDMFPERVAIARQRKEFEGKFKQQYLERGIPRLMLFVGLGKKANVTSDIIRVCAGIGAETLRTLGAKDIAIVAPDQQAVVEGALLRTYQFTQYKTQLKDYKELSSITILAKDATGIDTGIIIAESCNMARDLQNLSPIDLTPQVFAERAAKIAKEEKLSCTILDKAKLAKQGYGGMLSVGKGSSHEPRLVTLEYNPKNAKKTIAIIGKGITFDTGGISLKPKEKMSEMKFDMSGAASALCALRVASRLKLPVRIICVLCLAENMPDGNAYKPGDIVKTKLGKTIEIDNTDAEGRVVLADGLYHASTFKPDVMIDLATLTGACMVALGDVAAGIFGNNQELIDKLQLAAKESGERIWQLPLTEDYAEDIKSQIADMRNVGMPMLAGATAGAMLLKEFVGNIPWVHLDTSGVSWIMSRERYFTTYGGTGYGVRLLTQYLRNEAK